MLKRIRKRGPFQFLQFSMIGGMNALVDIGSLNLFLILWFTTDHLHLAFYNALAYTLAIINSYMWNSRLTFRKGSNGNMQQKFFFFMQALVSLGISTAVFIGVLSVLELFPIANWIMNNIAKGCAMILSSTASFFFMKYFVFVRSSRKSTKFYESL